MMPAPSSRTRSGGAVHGHSLLLGGSMYSSFSSVSGFASSRSPISGPRSASDLGFHSNQRSASPTRVYVAAVSSASFCISISDHPTSPGPGRSLPVSSRDHQIAKKPIAAVPPSSRRRTCMCSPTTHPGSFRCALHKNAGLRSGGGSASSSPSSRLNARRSAMTNSLVRIGIVEGSDLIKRALSALIRPSSHQQRRRVGFQPRRSRLSIMSKADDFC